MHLSPTLTVSLSLSIFICAYVYIYMHRYVRACVDVGIFPLSVYHASCTDRPNSSWLVILRSGLAALGLAALLHMAPDVWKPKPRNGSCNIGSATSQDSHLQISTAAANTDSKANSCSSQLYELEEQVLEAIKCTDCGGSGEDGAPCPQSPFRSL